MGLPSRPDNPEEFTPTELHSHTPPGLGQMLLEGRKHPRTAERFLVQVSSLHGPLIIELASVENLSFSGVRLTTKRSWELGLHVEVKAIAHELKARARVVYCKAIGPDKFAVGLNLIARDDGQAKPSTK